MLDAAYFPPPGRAGEVLVSTAGYQSLGTPIATMRLAAASIQWPTANVALFVPVVIPEPGYATKLWWENSNTAGGGNVDIGIYQEDGTRLVSSGSTAMGTLQALTVVDITDTLLQRGRYYVGMVSDTSSASSSFIGFNPAAGICQALGVVRQASAFPLATNANPATFVVTTHAAIPVCGIQMYRTVGP